ncbi:MAG: 50S ribosomal protein L18, partial [Actinomycetota bacterium]|nr:50S ribosomal protein L18 [Actinomycetota bacterium]
MSKVAEKRRQGRIIRHRRVRKKIHGTAARPRLAVFRSNKHLSLQLIDDEAGRTVASASTAEAAQRVEGSGATVAAATRLGQL